MWRMKKGNNKITPKKITRSVVYEYTRYVYDAFFSSYFYDHPLNILSVRVIASE